MQQELETFYPRTTQEWRDWLEKHHETHASIWVVFYKKRAGEPTITWSESVDEALCFGWIDSVKRKLDDNRSIQFFSPRKAKSGWSKVNKEKIERLQSAGKIHASGWRAIEAAKANGSWNLLDDVEALILPSDLEKALQEHPAAHLFFDALPKSVKKYQLFLLASAKRLETREKRLDAIVAAAMRGERL